MALEQVGLRAVIDGLPQFENAARTIDSTFDKLGASSEQGASKISRLGEIAKVAIGVAVGQIAVKAMQSFTASIGEFVAEGAKALRVEENFGRMAANYGIDADKMVEALKKAGAGLIDDTDLMQSFNNAVLATGPVLGHALGEALPQLLEISRGLARITNNNPAVVFDQMIYAIRKGVPKLIESNGLLIDSEKALQDYANSLGTVTTVSELSAEKQKKVLAATTESLGYVTELTSKQKTDIIKDYAKGLGKTTSEILASEKATVLLNASTKQLSASQKEAALRAASVSVTAVQVSDLTEEQKALALLNAVRAAGVEMLKKVDISTLNYIEKMQRSRVVIGQMKEDLGKRLVPLFDFFATRIAKVADWLGRHFNPALDLATRIILNAKNAFGKLFLALTGPFGVLVEMVGPVKALLMVIEEKFPALKKFIDGFTALSGQVGPLKAFQMIISELIPESVRTQLEKAERIVKLLGESLYTGLVKHDWTQAAHFVNVALMEVFGAENVDKFWKSWDGFWGKVSTRLDPAKEAIKEGLGKLTAAISTWYDEQGGAKGIFTKLAGMWDKYIIEPLSKVWGKKSTVGTNPMGQEVELAGSGILGALDTISKGMSTWWEDEGGLRGIVNKVIAKLDELQLKLQPFEDAWKTFCKNLGDFFAGFWSTFEPIAKTFGEQIALWVSEHYLPELKQAAESTGVAFDQMKVSVAGVNAQIKIALGDNPALVKTYERLGKVVGILVGNFVHNLIGMALIPGSILLWEWDWAMKLLTVAVWDLGKAVEGLVKWFDLWFEAGQKVWDILQRNWKLEVEVKIPAQLNQLLDDLRQVWDLVQRIAGNQVAPAPAGGVGVPMGSTVPPAGPPVPVPPPYVPTAHYDPMTGGYIGTWAKGGLIPGPVGMPFLATVHGGEYVVPAPVSHSVVNNYNNSWSPTVNANYPMQSGMRVGMDMESMAIRFRMR